MENYFSETEQAAFSPGNLVPGIGASPDKMLQARLMAYPDAQRYRVGTNANQLPVNSPRCPVQHYQRDGVMAGMLYQLMSEEQKNQLSSNISASVKERMLIQFSAADPDYAARIKKHMANIS